MSRDRRRVAVGLVVLSAVTIAVPFVVEPIDSTLICVACREVAHEQSLRVFGACLGTTRSVGESRPDWREVLGSHAHSYQVVGRVSGLWPLTAHSHGHTCVTPFACAFDLDKGLRQRVLDAVMRGDVDRNDVIDAMKCRRCRSRVASASLAQIYRSHTGANIDAVEVLPVK